MIRESLLEHIDELRARVLKIACVWVICLFIIYPFVGEVLKAIIQPVGKVIFVAPAAAFMAEFRLALLTSFLISSPFTFYQVWAFISTGLKAHEQKFVRFYGPLSLISFLLGACFAYFVVLPVSLNFFLGFGNDMMLPMITVDHYLGFFMSMTLAFGCIFEMPLVLIFLTAIGVATPEFMIQKRKHAIIILLVLSAFITPPDILSMMIMVGPLIVLYEMGLWASKWTYWKKHGSQT